MKHALVVTGLALFSAGTAFPVASSAGMANTETEIGARASRQESRQERRKRWRQRCRARQDAEEWRSAWTGVSPEDRAALITAGAISSRASGA